VNPPAAFHLLPLQLGDEEEVLDRALDALEPVQPGEVAFLPEAVAWTASGSGRAFATLLALAQERDASIITSMNLGGDLIEDLPGALDGERYGALVVFTRHGAVHVPQAKLTPQAFELDQALDGPGIAIAPYARLNRVRLDWDDQVLSARFLLCSDLWLLTRFSPAALRCDLLVVLANLPTGAEQQASRLIGRALEAGVARTGFLVNAYHQPGRPGRRPLAERAEEVLDAVKRKKPGARWEQPQALRRAFHLYDPPGAPDFAALSREAARKGRIPLLRPLSAAPAELGDYPITIVL